MANDSIQSRLRQFIGSKRMTIRDFERSLDLSAGYVNSVGGGISPKSRAVIAYKYPELSMDWLIEGEGEMIKEGANLPTPSEEEASFRVDVHNGIKFYPFLETTGGDFDGFIDNETGQDFVFFYIKGLEGCHAFTISGDSMSPTINPGSIVVVRQWTQRFIDNGKIYMIVTNEGHRMFKRLTLKETEEDGTMVFNCYSDNPDQIVYAPFELRGDLVVSLHVVKAVIPRFM